MRLLCDQNVVQRDIDACIETPDLHAITVRDALDPRVSDPYISTHAGEHGYVLTTDDDFVALSDMCGCIYFHQRDRPPVCDVLMAIRQIEAAYETPGAIVEVVPGGWV